MAKSAFWRGFSAQLRTYGSFSDLMKIGVSVEVGFHSGLESITTDRYRAELGWQ